MTPEKPGKPERSAGEFVQPQQRVITRVLLVAGMLTFLFGFSGLVLGVLRGSYPEILGASALGLASTLFFGLGAAIARLNKIDRYLRTGR